MSMKKLSVIVPIYNVEEYLTACIESILDQTYQNLELLLVDDGSTDNCKNICETYVSKDDRVRLLSQSNAGQGAARNRALDIAQGEYIAFVDADDYIDRDMYSVMIRAMEETESDIANCGLVTHSGIRNANSDVPEKNRVWVGAENVLREYFDSQYINGSPCNKVYCKHLFDEIRFPEGVAREDVYIMYRLLGKCQRAVHVGQCFYHYNVRVGSSEHQEFSPKFLISIKIADDRKDYIEQNYPALLPLAQKSCYGSRLSAIKKITRSHVIKENRQVYDELLAYIKANTPYTKEQKNIRFKILYVPWLYRIEMDFRHSWRSKFKRRLLKILK